jgi:hypothetical protein
MGSTRIAPQRMAMRPRVEAAMATSRRAGGGSRPWHDAKVSPLIGPTAKAQSRLRSAGRKSRQIPSRTALGCLRAASATALNTLPSAVIDRRYRFATVTVVLTELAMKQFSRAE